MGRVVYHWHKEDDLTNDDLLTVSWAWHQIAYIKIRECGSRIKKKLEIEGTVFHVMRRLRVVW